MINNTEENDKHFKTIKEVAKILNEKEYTIRFWLSKFKNISLNQIGGYQKRKFFSQKDINKFKIIQFLLKEKKYTIEGAVKELSRKNVEINDKKFILLNELKNISNNLKNLINS